MRITIVYDNEALAGFRKDWGFSCLVGEHILFDTGANYDILLSNMQRLNIDLNEIDIVVLSHVHGDHTGGIDIIGNLENVRVFIPTSFFSTIQRHLSRFDNTTLVKVNAPVRVAENIMSTGEIARMEQSLLVRTQKGIVIITGCSHPGLDTIIGIAEQYGKIYGVIGGFHGFDKLERLRGIELIAPCHCTKKKQQIYTAFPEVSKYCAVGCIFKV